MTHYSIPMALVQHLLPGHYEIKQNFISLHQYDTIATKIMIYIGLHAHSGDELLS